MPSRRVILLLALAGVVLSVGLVAGSLYMLQAWFSVPLFASAPAQPIEFPHTVHAEEMGLACEFCHRNVTQGAAATLPSVGQCVLCHQFIEGTSPAAQAEIGKLLDACGPLLPADAPGTDLCPEGQPIDWVRVHRLPDHVQFVHEPHIRFFSAQEEYATSSEICSICHGDVKSMERVKQVRSLKMGDCVSCHKENNAPTDCTTCHF